VPYNSSTKGNPGRYTLPAQALHWITAVLMFALLPLAWVMVTMPRAAANRELIYTLHKSLGLTVLALVAARLIYSPFFRHRNFRAVWRAGNAQAPRCHTGCFISS
jgi:cytochrome b561